MNNTNLAFTSKVNDIYKKDIPIPENKLNFIKFVNKQASKRLGMIKRNFEYINKDVFEVLYGTLVRPQLE